MLDCLSRKQSVNHATTSWNWLNRKVTLTAKFGKHICIFSHYLFVSYTTFIYIYYLYLVIYIILYPPLLSNCFSFHIQVLLEKCCSQESDGRIFIFPKCSQNPLAICVRCLWVRFLDAEWTMYKNTGAVIRMDTCFATKNIFYLFILSETKKLSSHMISWVYMQRK